MAHLPIDQLKKAIKFGVDTGNVFAAAMEDKVFKPIEAFGFVAPLAQLPEIINSRKEIIAQAKDIDSAEGVEIRAYVRDELKVPNELVETAIDDGIALVLATGKMIQTSIAIRKSRKGV